MDAPRPVIQLLQLTDPHLFADSEGELRGVNTARSLQQVIQLARRRHWPPRAILATGDLVQDDSEGAYDRFAEQFGNLGMPVYCLPGNHDVPALMAEKLCHSPFHTLGSAEFEGWTVALLDSTKAGSASGFMRDEELARLDLLLHERNTQHVLVCLHHHPVASGSRWLDTVGLENAQALFDVIHRHQNVRGLLWGHVHQAYDRVANGIRLLGTPSTCAQFLPHSPTFELDKAPPAYRWLKLHADGTIETGIETLSK